MRCYLEIAFDRCPAPLAQRCNRRPIRRAHRLEDRHAVPGTLALPDCTIAKGSKGMCRKRQLVGLELLEANDVWLRFGEPIHEIIQAFVDVVDVKSDETSTSSPQSTANCELTRFPVSCSKKRTGSAQAGSEDAEACSNARIYRGPCPVPAAGDFTCRAFREEPVSRAADFRGAVGLPSDGIVTRSNSS